MALRSQFDDVGENHDDIESAVNIFLAGMNYLLRFHYVIQDGDSRDNLLRQWRWALTQLKVGPTDAAQLVSDGLDSIGETTYSRLNGQLPEGRSRKESTELSKTRNGSRWGYTTQFAERCFATS